MYRFKSIIRLLLALPFILFWAVGTGIMCVATWIMCDDFDYEAGGAWNAFRWYLKVIKAVKTGRKDA